MEIEFVIFKESVVDFKIYDVSGRLVIDFPDKPYRQGYYSLSWDASEYSSGVYFINMITEDFIDTQKITLIK